MVPGSRCADWSPSARVGSLGGCYLACKKNNNILGVRIGTYCCAKCINHCCTSIKYVIAVINVNFFISKCDVRFCSSVIPCLQRLDSDQGSPLTSTLAPRRPNFIKRTLAFTQNKSYESCNHHQR